MKEKEAVTKISEIKTDIQNGVLRDRLPVNQIIDNNLINTDLQAEKKPNLQLILEEKRLAIGKKIPDLNDKSRKRELPAFLKNVLKTTHKDAAYAANLLVDTYQADNENYYGGDGEHPSEAYLTDKRTLSEYYERKTGNNNLPFQSRINLEKKIMNADVSILVKDEKPGLFGDTPSMQEVKERANLVQGLLKNNLTPYMKDGRLNSELFDNIVVGAFDAAISSCNRYNELHQDPGSPWGKRRKRYVTNLLRDLQKQREQYRNIGLALEMGLFTKDVKDISTPEELLESVRVFTLHKVNYQKEGNSTDVYLVLMMGEDNKLHKYYIKEILPLLDKDVDGFINRRLNQLNRSEQNKSTFQINVYDEEEAAAHMEEDRMSRAGADGIDYANGKELLNFFKNRIDGASEDDKEGERQYCADFFRYNFDKMFMDLSDYNAAIRVLNKRIADGNQLTIEQWEQKAKTDKTAAMVVKILRDNNLAVQKMKEYTASDWMIKQMKLERGKDASIIDLLQRIDAQDHLEKEEKKPLGRLEKLFRVTMGKEVELYGQMMEGDKKRESDMAQYNTLTTSALAQKMGFSEEVVNTTMGFAEFPRWDGTWANGVITMQDVAYGQEFDEIVLSADEISKDWDQKLVLSPNAMCQLTRLWAFDVFTNQTDRHGRNFKCVIGKRKSKYDPYVILSIKAYDHDQSLAPKDLFQSFGMEYDNQGNLISTKKNGFLQEPIKLVKKNTPLYYYIWSKYFHGNNSAGWTRNMKEPEGISDDDKLRISGIVFGEKKYRNSDSKDVPVFRGAIDLSGEIEDLQGKNGFDFFVTKRVYDMNEGKYVYREFNCTHSEYGSDIKEVFKSLQKCITDIADFYLVDSPDEKLYNDGKSSFEVAFKKHKPIKDMSENELLKLRKAAIAIDDLYKLNRSYGFKHVKLSPDSKEGDLQKWVDFTLYNFAQTYGQDPQVLDFMYDKDMPEDFKKLKNKNGDLEVPSLLHMDKKAYDDLKAQIDEFENGNNQAIMRKYHMTEEQIQAAHDRLVQEVRMMDLMAEKAELILQNQRNDKLKKFFLTKEEFANIDSPTELAIDPGNSYIAMDNEHYLYTQDDYTKWLDKNERQKGLEQRNKVLTDSKRLHGKPLESMKCCIRNNINFKEIIDKGRADVDWMQFKKDKELIKSLWEEKSTKWRNGAKSRANDRKEQVKDTDVRDRIQNLLGVENKLTILHTLHANLAEKLEALAADPGDQKSLNFLREKFSIVGDGKYKDNVEDILSKDNEGKKKGFMKLFVTIAENDFQKAYDRLVLDISKEEDKFKDEKTKLFNDVSKNKIEFKMYSDMKAKIKTCYEFSDALRKKLSYHKDRLDKDTALLS